MLMPAQRCSGEWLLRCTCQFEILGFVRAAFKSVWPAGSCAILLVGPDPLLCRNRALACCASPCGLFRCAAAGRGRLSSGDGGRGGFAVRGGSCGCAGVWRPGIHGLIAICPLVVVEKRLGEKDEITQGHFAKCPCVVAGLVIRRGRWWGVEGGVWVLSAPFLKPEFYDAAGFRIANGLQIRIELEVRDGWFGREPALVGQVDDVSFAGGRHAALLNGRWWCGMNP